VNDRAPVASVAHQVGNPLAVIRGYAELLGVRDDEATRLEAAAQIREAADVLELMVDDLVVVLGLETGALPFEPETLDVASVAEEAISFVEVRSPRHSVATQWESGTPLLARADVEHLPRILTTLMLNACRRIPDGGEILVGGRSDGDVVTVSISDTGRRTAEAVEPSELRSTGLELYKVRRLVELHGGTVDEGRGSTVSFTLPGAGTGARP
jgi:signal transduction histidine kinase